MRLVGAGMSAVLAAVGCGSRESSPALTMPDLGGQGAPSDLREELIFVPGATAPDNPERGLATPPEWNGSRVLTVQSPELDGADVVVIGVPGLYAGINNWRLVAQELVRRDPIHTVAWAYERRGNNMEDLAGVQYAEATGDLQAAFDYYFSGRAIDGQSFAGFRKAKDLAFQSEWGIGTHFRDLRGVIAAARQAHPGAAVVWMGHSMGSFWGEAFPAFEFDCTSGGTIGADLLDGLILVDGTITDDFAVDLSSYSEASFRDGASLRVAGVTVPAFGLTRLRQGAEILSDAGAGEILLGLELAALAGVLEPGREVATYLAERLFGFDLAYGIVHGHRARAAGLAAIGLLFDDDTQPLYFARAHLGQPVGAPLVAHGSPLAVFGGSGLLSEPGAHPLLTPATSDAWVDWDDTREAGPEQPLVTGREALELFYSGPANFLEWYFPMRLLLDLSIGAGITLDPARRPEWAGAYDLCFGDPARVALPTLAVGAQLGVVADAHDYGDWLARTSVSDVTYLTLAGHNHADMLAARDPRRNPLLDAASAWLAARW